VAADPGPRYAVHTPGDTLTLREQPSSTSRELGHLEHGRVLHVRSTAYRQNGDSIVGIPWASVDLEGDLEHSGFVHTGHLRALGQ